MKDFSNFENNLKEILMKKLMYKIYKYILIKKYIKFNTNKINDN